MKKKVAFNWEEARARLERAGEAIDSGGRNVSHVDALLRSRAASLARPLAASRPARTERETIVVFRLGEERLAAPLSRVAEVIRHARITPAPGTPPEVAGLIQVRGEIRVVWDLRRLLGKQTDKPENATILLLKRGLHEAGLLVDEVEDVREIGAGDRRSPPEARQHVAWMTSDLVIVLETETLLPGDME